MDCPKCGHQQDATDKCESCGVYFAKLQPSPAVTRSTSLGKSPRRTPAPEPAAPGIGPGALVVTAAITAVIGGAFMYGRGKSPSTDSKVAPPVAQQRVIQEPLPPPDAVAAQSAQPSPAAGPIAASVQPQSSQAATQAALAAARDATVLIETGWG